MGIYAVFSWFGRAGLGRVVGLTVLGSLFCATAFSAPLLRCELTYAGSTHIVNTMVGGDPYKTESVDVDGRFRFKTVILGTAQKIDAIKLYAYYETSRQPILIEEAKYLPPFANSDSPYALTGLHMLYAPPLGRELQYGCALREGKS
ncbi:MAG TPA: hypothetical protein VNW52_02760, partial [Burkholderiaceae bacterium]|jgi:hypothetical protein|nr:hypothetical protein [Burkholderiaceae bacterium]